MVLQTHIRLHRCDSPRPLELNTIRETQSPIVDFACFECGFPFRKTRAWLEASSSTLCPNCGKYDRLSLQACPACARPGIAKLTRTRSTLAPACFSKARDWRVTRPQPGLTRLRPADELQRRLLLRILPPLRPIPLHPLGDLLPRDFHVYRFAGPIPLGSARQLTAPRCVQRSVTR
jgi:hypothetical protein